MQDYDCSQSLLVEFCRKNEFFSRLIDILQFSPFISILLLLKNVSKGAAKNSQQNGICEKLL